MVNQSTEKIFYHYVRKKPELFDIIKPDFFQNKNIQLCYKLDIQFYQKYFKLPKPDMLSEILKSKKAESFFYIDEDGNDEFDHRLFNSIFDVEIAEYDETWLQENFESWAQFKTLDLSIFEVISLLKTTDINSDNVKNIVTQVKELILTKNNLSFDFDIGSNFKDATKHKSKKMMCVSTGYEWFDMTLGGGYSPGELIVIAAAPKAGKSTTLTNLGARAMMNGHNVSLISMEMSEQAYLKRFGCNLLNMTMDDYDKFVCDDENLQDRLNEFNSMSGMTMKVPGELYVKGFPTGTAGVPEIESYLSKLEEVTNKKINVVVLDYLNIMKNWRNPNTENLYVKVKQICEDVRAMAQRLDVAIVSVTQLNRAGSNSSQATMNDISESVGLVQTADAVFAINKRDQIDKEKNHIYFSALALRNAKTPDEPIRYNVDFDRMQITEDTDYQVNNSIDVENMF